MKIIPKIGCSDLDVNVTIFFELINKVNLIKKGDFSEFKK